MADNESCLITVFHPPSLPRLEVWIKDSGRLTAENQSETSIQVRLAYRFNDNQVLVIKTKNEICAQIELAKVIIDS